MVNLLVAVFVIATVSSVMPVTLGNIQISPNTQVLMAAWAAVGIPLVVGAGVGIVYRVETFLRTYFWYLAATLAVEGLFFIKFLISGSVCSTFAPRDLERLGTTFVCGITDTFALFWGLIVIGISAYFLYIIWAAQNDIKKGYWPELMKYRDAWCISTDGIPYAPAPVVGSQLPTTWKLPGSATVGAPGSVARSFPAPAYGSVPPVRPSGSISVPPVRTRSVSPPPNQYYSVSGAVPAAAYPAVTSTAPRSPRGSIGGFLPSPASWTPVATSQIL